MTVHDDFDRLLSGWFEADALAPAPTAGLERVLAATRRRRPRPAWLAGFGSQWVGETTSTTIVPGGRRVPRASLRWSTALILVLLLAAILGGAILVGARLLQDFRTPTGQLGHLAYGLDGGIYVADWDGRNPVRIASSPPDDPTDCRGVWGEGQIWAPDGRHLAYRTGSALSSCGAVSITDPAGHVVASFPGTGWLISWSPDSTRVATWVEERKTIGVYGLDGVRQALITLPPETMGRPGDYDPVWSLDGRSVVPPSRIWELPVDGGTPRRVDSDPGWHRDAVYPRDGARVAYIPYLDSLSLVIAEAGGTQLRVLQGAKNDPIYGPGDGDYYEDPVWSPTGDRVAFLWHHGGPYDQPGNPPPDPYDIRVLDVASGTVTTLASARGNGSLRAIRFSPEGDRILFSRTDGDTATSLWSVDADGSDAQLLVSGTSWGDWQWQPAGP